jgi:hypothetical protein
MNPKLIKQYKERFKAIRKIEAAENKKLSIQEKFKQLISVFSSSIGQLTDLAKERKSASLESNWAILKR